MVKKVFIMFFWLGGLSAHTTTKKEEEGIRVLCKYCRIK